MPRIKNIPGPYRFFFTSFDCNEPPHVHVERENHTGTFRLEPLGLASNHGFSASRLRKNYGEPSRNRRAEHVG